METITSEMTDMYVPEAALIAFKAVGDCSYYLESRSIRKDGTMGAAKPVSKEFIQNLLAAFSAEYRSTPHGEIPENLLFCDSRQGKEIYLWYNPPMKRHRFFDIKLNLKDGEYNVPGTLYLVKGGNLYVWCFAGKKPKRTDTLLGVPYFNIYADGRVCMGTAHPSIPDTENLTYNHIMNGWENAFWNSKDVHTNGSPSTKENLIETIRKYKDKPFDTKELEKRKDNLTLDEILRRITRL